MQIQIKGTPIAVVRIEAKTYSDGKKAPEHNKVQFQYKNDNGLLSVLTVKDEFLSKVEVGKECVLPIALTAVDGNIYYRVVG
jgi:hypothetical protein